jgi:hypothetical protein
MGCFSSSNNKGTVPMSERFCTYARQVKVPIKVRNKTGTIVGSQSVEFQLSEPILVSNKEVQIGSSTFLVSSCVLPGLDPRGDYKKKCQDNCFYLSNDEGILCCLFDGHGSHGERVAEFCQNVIERIFRSEAKMLSVGFI